MVYLRLVDEALESFRLLDRIRRPIAPGERVEVVDPEVVPDQAVVRPEYVERSLDTGGHSPLLLGGHVRLPGEELLTHAQVNGFAMVQDLGSLPRLDRAIEGHFRWLTFAYGAKHETGSLALCLWHDELALSVLRHNCIELPVLRITLNGVPD